MVIVQIGLPVVAERGESRIRWNPVGEVELGEDNQMASLRRCITDETHGSGVVVGWFERLHQSQVS